jgi:signal transduction histidine kinase
MRSLRHSLLAKFLLVVVFASLLPMVLLGMWLTTGLHRSGEAMLELRLDSTLTSAVRDIGARWLPRRSSLFAIASDTTLIAALSRQRPDRIGRLPVDLAPRAAEALRTATELVLVRDAAERARFVLETDNAGRPVLAPASDSLRVRGTALPGPTLPLRVPITAGVKTVGYVDSRWNPEALLASSSVTGAGILIAVRDRANHQPLLMPPWDPALLDAKRFAWGGEEWMTARRTLDEPYIELVAAAPASSFIIPLDRQARRGIFAVAIVSVVGFLFTAYLTRRLTRSLVTLVAAADAVARGDLDRNVSISTNDEVGRLASSFNAMTESLRRTLAELSQQQAVAAVGEFASGLAHEIRNPLTAMRLNLQVMQERLQDDDAVHMLVDDTLRDVNRLDHTVASALRMARTGQMQMADVDISEIVDAAVRSVVPQAALRSVTIAADRGNGVRALGNAPSLEQVVLNLLLNAVEASPDGARVDLVVTSDSESVMVEVRDQGPGFSTGSYSKAFQPFYSTKPEGTGLGLAVVRRIVGAHGGRVELSHPGHSGLVRVVLQRSNGPEHAA